MMFFMCFNNNLKTATISIWADFHGNETNQKKNSKWPPSDLTPWTLTLIKTHEKLAWRRETS